MEQINTKVRKWGNSFGIILPKQIVDLENIREGLEVNVMIQTKNKTKVKDIFGILKGKLKKDTRILMKEVDKELWGIE